MNDPNSEADALDLLSRLCQRPLAPEAVTPSVLFLSALMAATLGVIYADGMVEAREKRLLDRMLDTLLPIRTETRSLLDAILGGFLADPVYQSPDGWLPLARALAPNEQLLLLSLGYEMAAADGEIAPAERQQLQEVARSLAIDPQYEAAIAAIAENEALPNAQSLQKVAAVLEPQAFRHLGIRLVSFAATELLSRWSGYPFSQVNTPPVAVFLGALTVLTLEMMAADGQVTAAELDLVAASIASLLPAPDAGGLRTALLDLVEHLQANPDSRNPSDWLKVARSLVPSERFLLLAFAYELAAVDGIVPVEREYIGAVAQSLAVPLEALPLLDAAFAGEAVTARAEWHALLAALHPDGFAHLAPAIVAAASNMREKLAVLAR